MSEKKLNKSITEIPFRTKDFKGKLLTAEIEKYRWNLLKIKNILVTKPKQ
jgi:hypothetical protein